MTDNTTLVKRALRQTYLSGHQYVAIPFPWWQEFCENTEWHGDETGIPWGDLCMCASTEDEDVLLCIKPNNHDDRHGWQRGVTEP